MLVIDLKFDKHSKVLQVNNLSAFPNVPYIPAIRTSDSGTVQSHGSYHADRLQILSEKHTNLPAVLSFDGIKPNKMWGWEGGNLFSLYPISKFVCFESETERNPRMQFFVRNPREGHTKLIRNIPVTTDKLIYEIVINFVILDNLRETNNKHINMAVIGRSFIYVII